MIALIMFPLDDDEHGGAEWDLVVRGADGKPRCADHGAMNRVSENDDPAIWRCITTSGAKFNPCRAACHTRRST